MKQRISIICTIVMMVLLVFGCGPKQLGTTGATHQVTDGTGTVVTVPTEPKRIVPIAASTAVSYTHLPMATGCKWSTFGASKWREIPQRGHRSRIW